MSMAERFSTLSVQASPGVAEASFIADGQTIRLTLSGSLQGDHPEPLSGW